MITSAGSTHIKRYLAAYEPELAAAIAFGVGEAPEQLGDVRLQYEIGRSPINLTSYDFVNNRLIFKATLDEGFDGLLYEFGLYSREDSSAGAFGSRLLLSFDSDTEACFNGGCGATYTTNNTRIVNDSATVVLNPSSTATLTCPDQTMDLGEYSAADTFVFAFYSSTINVTNIRVRFYTDDSNYYSVTTTGAVAAGFNIASIPKGNATVTGAPNWANITKVDITATTNGTAGGATINFEGIRIEDVDTIDNSYVLVARTVLTTPFQKIAGRIQEIEFPLGVTV
jgi:hypothetical protein